MADATTVVEGKIKFRDGKKWKPRWCILKKPSPVADQLQVVLYKDVSQAVKDEAKPKNSFVLEAFFGLDAGITFDREQHVLAIICQKTTILMAFEQREQMIQFEIKIRLSLGEEHQFPVTVVKAPSSSRLLKEQVRLVIHDLRFCLIAQTPPKILLSWNIQDLRRFGTTENKFCFEGGSRCGKGTGVFALQSEQAKDIEDIVHLASIGKMSKGHRKSKIRSSQVDLSTHLIADMLPSHSSSYIHHHHHQNSGSKNSSPQAQLPVTLNCCYDNQTGSAESEDWSWYKRHSVSVMDHHRIVASRDNKEHFMGIYDVPPNHGRKLADNLDDGQEEPNYAVPRAYLECATSDSLHNSNNDYSNYNPNRSNDGNPEDQNKCKGVDGFSLQVKDTASKSPSPSASREESLQRLKLQESDLQREMVLLDEILQNCSTKNHEKSLEPTKNDQTCSNVNSNKCYKYPSLDDHLTIISGNISPFSIKLENPHPPTRMDRVMAERLNTSMPEQLPASPLCKRKPKNILAPLPYVNLSRYDDESYSHVHLPGSSDSIPLVRDPVGVDVKQVRLRGQSSSLINLTQASAQQVPGRHSSDAAIEIFCPTCKFTTLTLPIDVIPRNTVDSYTYVWSQRPITSHNFSENISECNHPAKTVLRPRSGHEYVVIKRKAKLVTTSHLNSASGKVFTFDPEHHDTLSVLSSLSTPQNSPNFSSAEGTIRSLYPDSWLLHSITATPSPCPSLNQRCIPQPPSASHRTQGAEKHFAPADVYFPFSPPPSPYQHKPWASQQVHYPIYVNQEYTAKQPQPLSAISSSSVSPIQFSALFSPKPNSCADFHYIQQKKNHSLRHSDPDPCKFANFQFSLSSSQGLTTEPQLGTESTHHPDLHALEKSGVSKKEYDKFTSSSIIARRRSQLPTPEDKKTESSSASSSNLLLQIPQVKSSGYKNIDSFNAAAAVSSTHSFTLPRGTGIHSNSVPRIGTSQNDITTNQPELEALSVSDSLSTFSSDTLHYLYNPPPPIRVRHVSTSSSSTSLSSSPCLTPVDSSDSPPSYYAPSPPYTPPAPPVSPPPPIIPPRQRLLRPAPLVVPPSPSDRTTDTSDDEEQELNYIEVDMTKASGEPSPRPQTVYYRPSKRAQKKERDSAKLRYVLIDHSATKALQQARQEHVQARDGTQIKSTTQLNRINSAPASSKKKHFTFISRERKLSSGSVESC